MWNKLLTYLYIRKPAHAAENINVKMMHKVNRLTLLMFLFALIVIVFRFIFK